MIRILILTLFVAISAQASSQNESPSLSIRLSNLIRASLTEKIADAEIRIPSLDKLLSVPPMSRFTEFKSVHLLIDKTNGIAQFEVLGVIDGGKEDQETIQTPYEAWKKVSVATHRIFPNTKLKNEDFRTSEVNVASGPAREYRGVMQTADTDYSSLMSKQSILEGQYVMSSAILRAPDLNKGDSVRLELISGDLTLTTQATLQEPGTIGSRVHVVTAKTKRDLMGVIQPDHSVEVQL